MPKRQPMQLWHSAPMPTPVRSRQWPSASVPRRASKAVWPSARAQPLAGMPAPRSASRRARSAMTAWRSAIPPPREARMSISARHRRQYVGQFRFEHRPRLWRADHGRQPDDVRNRNQHLRASGGQLGSKPCRAETSADDAHRRCGRQRVDSANPNLPMPASAGQTEVAKKLTELQVNRSTRHCPARACAARRSTGSS
jgi:hypothetical protein